MPFTGRRLFCGCMLAATLVPPDPAGAQPAAAPAPDPALVADLVAANRILYDQGVVDGFGHVSARHDKDKGRFLLARSMAPALVTAADIMEYDLDGTPVGANGRASYLERFIHSEIYRRRPDVGSVVHSHSPGVIPFGVSATKLRPIYHMSGFLRPEGTKVFEIREAGGTGTNMLISSPALGRALAEALGDDSVILMRGHGSTTVGPSVRLAVFRAVYTEVNARLEAEALKLGDVTFLDPAEAASAAATNAGLVDRPWELWRKKAAEGH